jgi:hypothetical protein
MPILFAKDAFLNLNVNKPIQMKIYTIECGVRTLTAKVETLVKSVPRRQFFAAQQRIAIT